MTNALAVAINFAQFLATAVIGVIAFLKQRDKPLIKQISLLCLVVAGWQLCEIGFFLTNIPALARFFFDAKLVFVSTAPVLVLFLSYKFYIRRPSPAEKKLAAVLFIVPAVTSVLALTSTLHPFIRKEFAFVETFPLYTYINVRGLWFWVHSAHCYLVILATILIILTQHKRLPKEYKTPSSLLLAGALVAFFCNISTITDLYSPAVDVTLIGLSVSLIFFYVAVSANNKMDFLALARKEIFWYLEERIFILDLDRSVADVNRSGRQWLQSLDIEPGSLSFWEVTSRIGRDLGPDALKGANTEDGVDIYLSSAGHPLIYNLRERPIRNSLGEQIGFIASFTDVTRYKLLIDRLEETAGIDPLTGLGNRRSYERARKALDRAENLPLSVILGDVNALKMVNDTQGHQAGDTLLRVVASVLSDSCPPGGAAYRIGGDEFLMLLPHVSVSEAKNILAGIQMILSKIKRYPFAPSIALGCATKSAAGEDLEELVRQADGNMYRSKASARAEQKEVFK